jgi:hypothetical protein
MESRIVKLIDSDSCVWSFKWNSGVITDDYLDDIFSYVRDQSEVLACSFGLHEEGKAAKPHIHLTYIVKPFNMTPVTCNPTDHRKKWCKKNDLPADHFKGKLSVKLSTIDADKPLYYPLAYPLKERKRLPSAKYRYSYMGHNSDNEPCRKFGLMSDEMIMFLEEVGAGLFDASKSKQEARDKDDNKKKRQREQLLAFCRENGSYFDDYKSLVLFLDEAYYAAIPFEEKPDLVNYKKNIQIVAVELKILKASDFIFNGRL